jgi:molybdopterin/thiamine biosynthesis adenylyltransferase/rhodanese-related sulfurtransferase
MQHRYDRQIALPEWGESGQERIHQSKVLIVGAGGLGVPVLQYLAGAGVGTIGISDGDSIDISNLHRQPLYDADDINRNKAQVAAEKIFLLNKQVSTIVYPFALKNANALAIIHEYNVIVDATDNFPARYMLNDACVLLNKPLVYGAVSSWEGQVAVFNWKGGATYRCLFPQPPLPGAIPDCNTNGILGTIPGTIGMLMATEVIKMMIGAGEILSGTLLHWQALQQQFHSFHVDRQKQEAHTMPGNAEQFVNWNYPTFCGIKQTEVMTPEHLDEVLSTNTYQLLDVREIDEKPAPISGAIRWPLSAISIQQNKPSLEKNIVVYCQTGNRSKEAIPLLEKYYPELHFFHLEGGIKAWQLFKMNQQYGRA